MKRVILTVAVLGLCIGSMQVIPMMTGVLQRRGTGDIGVFKERVIHWPGKVKVTLSPEVQAQMQADKKKAEEVHEIAKFKELVRRLDDPFYGPIITEALNKEYITRQEKAAVDEAKLKVKAIEEEIQSKDITPESVVLEEKEVDSILEEIEEVSNKVRAVEDKIPTSLFGRVKRWVEMNPKTAAALGIGAGLVGGYLAHKYKLPEKGWSAGKAGAGLGWRGTKAGAGLGWRGLKGGAGLAGRGVVGGARLAGRGVAEAGKGIAGGARLAGRGVAGGARLAGRGVIGAGRLTGRGLYGAGKLAGRGAAGVGRGVAGSVRFAGRGVIGAGKLTGRGLYGAGRLAGKGITGGAGLGWRGIKGLAGGAWGLTKGGARGVWDAGKFGASIPKRLVTSPEQVRALGGQVAAIQEQLTQQQAQQAALQRQIASEQAAKQQLQRQLEATKKQEEGFAQELFQEKQKSLWELAKERLQNYGR